MKCIMKVSNVKLDPYVTNGLSHPYHLNKSTFIFRGIRSKHLIFISFSKKFLQANRIASDGMTHSAASYLGLFYLPHEKDALKPLG